MKIYINKTDQRFVTIRIRDNDDKPLKKYAISYESGKPVAFYLYKKLTPESGIAPYPISNEQIQDNIHTLISFSEGKVDIEGARNVPEYEPITPCCEESLIITDDNFTLQLL